MKSSIATDDRQCVYWLPCMAQDNLKIVENNELFMKYDTTEGLGMYLIHTFIDYNPSVKDGDGDFRGLRIKAHVVYFTLSDLRMLYSKEHYKVVSPSIKHISRDMFLVFTGAPLHIHGYHKLSDIRRRTTYAAKLKKYRRSFIKQKQDLWLTLTLRDYTKYGLALFEIFFDRFADFYDGIKQIIYHQVKLHFHKHHFHEMMLKTTDALYLDEDHRLSELRIDNNPGLLHYIKNYHDVVKLAIDVLYGYYYSIDSQSKQSDKRVPKKQREEMKRDFYDASYDLSGMCVFLQNLLNCSENKICRLENSQCGEDKDLKEMYQNYANNIANARMGAEALRNKIRYHHDEEELQTAKWISRVSLWLGFFSVGLALLSFKTIRGWISLGWEWFVNLF